MPRVVIAGSPRAGKTTLSNTFKGTVLHTDDLIGRYEWSAASEEVARWFDRPYDVIEGVAAVRALRKWLDSHPVGRPCDQLIWLTRPFVALTPGQATMAKGCDSVFQEIRQELHRRSVRIDFK